MRRTNCGDDQMLLAPQVVQGQEVVIENETEQGGDGCQREDGNPGPGALPPAVPHMLPELHELSEAGVQTCHGAPQLMKPVQVHQLT